GGGLGWREAAGPGGRGDGSGGGGSAAGQGRGSGGGCWRRPRGDGIIQCRGGRFGNADGRGRPSLHKRRRGGSGSCGWTSGCGSEDSPAQIQPATFPWRRDRGHAAAVSLGG